MRKRQKVNFIEDREVRTHALSNCGSSTDESDWPKHSALTTRPDPQLCELSIYCQLYIIFMFCVVQIV